MGEAERRKALELLGLGPGACGADIKTAYRDMAKVWHPDRFAHDPRLQQKAQEKLKEINEAYRSLLADADSPRPRGTTRNTQDAPRAAHDTDDATRDAGATRDDGGAPRDGRDATRDGGDASRSAWNETRGAQDGVGRRDTLTVTREGEGRRKSGWLVAAPALVFCATFALVTPRLLSTRTRQPLTVDDGASAAQQSRGAQTEEARAEDARRQTDDDARAKGQRAQKPSDAAVRAEFPAARDGDAEAAATPLHAMPTVSVLVDPTTNLLARADCPHRVRMTFPAGEEPHAYCNADHGRAAATQPADETKGTDKSRIKSFAGRLASPSKWFSDKNSNGGPAKKSAPREQ